MTVNYSEQTLSHPRSILFVASEMHPLVKTGGLADVMSSLPQAVKNRGHDVRIIMPGYKEALAKVENISHVTELMLAVHPSPVNLLSASLPDSDITIYFVDSIEYFNRDGGPYVDPEGQTWPDNAARFALFSRVVCEVAQDRVGLNWKPHIVHANDWQTGLIPALLSQESNRPSTVFTIHNLAYQGLYPSETLDQLALPREWWTPEALEFHSHISFIKGGLIFSDVLTTVSPTYADEICNAGFGFGLEGLLKDREETLFGILNGVDYEIWSPSKDPLIPCQYSIEDTSGKAENKKRLQKRAGLKVDSQIPLLGTISRLVPQKGVDLILSAIPDFLENSKIQLVILGSGESHFEQGLTALAEKFPDNLSVTIGFDEQYAHEIEAGSDIFLMPSRFEPCGLNQIYSMKYGTLPLVHATGGLADTVTHASPENLLKKEATGFCFKPATPEKLTECLNDALKLYNNPGTWWQNLMENAMQQDFSWEKSAQQYEEIYSKLKNSNNAPPPRPSRHTKWTGRNYVLRKPKH